MAVAVGKVHLYRIVLHGAGAVGAAGLGVAYSVLRTRPVIFAVYAAALLAFAIGPASTLVGIELAAVLFAALMTVFFAIATGLRAVQDRRLR